MASLLYLKTREAGGEIVRRREPSIRSTGHLSEQVASPAAEPLDHPPH